MLHYDALEHALQAFLRHHAAPLTASQLRRIVLFGAALVLASRCHLRLVARFLHRPTRLSARVQWLQRLLKARFVRPEIVYEPVLKSVLAQQRVAVWHVVIDRTHVPRWHCDVLMVALAYRKRALPLVWCRIRSGHAPTATCLSLLQRAATLFPPHAAILLHGDCEFGHAALLRWVSAQRWDFILAQSRTTQFQAQRHQAFQPLQALPVTRQRGCFVANVWLGVREAFGQVNLYAFYQPHHEAPTRRSRTVQYLATNLPQTRLIKVLGRRRWGIEALFRDWKSGGWDWEQCAVQSEARREAWMTLMALCTLWLVLVGRAVCQHSQRASVDLHAQRHLSFFQIGADWLVAEWRWHPDKRHLFHLRL
jgi:hypothetical protein